MARNETQTCRDLALYAKGWTTAKVLVEKTIGRIEVFDGRAYRRSQGRMDYLWNRCICLVPMPMEHRPETIQTWISMW
jgi:hypothetical protein